MKNKKEGKKEVEGLDSGESIEVSKEKIFKEDLKEVEKHQNKILRNVFIWIGAFVLMILLVVFFLNSVRQFDYENVNFKVIEEGGIVFYNTAIPLYESGGVSLVTGKVIDKHTADYNFYIRNDPRKLDKDVPFNGELKVMKGIAIEGANDFKCNGDEVIAFANLFNLYGVLGVQQIVDENAGCDEQGRYMFLNVVEGEETRIDQFGPSCYTLTLSDACDILPITERFMTETFVLMNEVGFT